jgi:hypothetical protein
MTVFKVIIINNTNVEDSVGLASKDFLSTICISKPKIFLEIEARFREGRKHYVDKVELMYPMITKTLLSSFLIHRLFQCWVVHRIKWIITRLMKSAEIFVPH